MQNFDLTVETAREFLQQISQFLPKLAAALFVVVVGWLLAKVARFLVERALRAINFPVLTQRAGTDHFLQQAGMGGDTTTLFGLVAYWLVLIAAFTVAFGKVELPYIADLLHRLELFGPKLLIAMLLVIFGSYCARFVGNAVHAYCLQSEVPDAELIGKIAQYLIMVFVVMIAIAHIEIGGDLVQRTFLILLGGLVLAFALAFGIGGKDWAAAMLERWWPRQRRDREP